MAPMTFPTKPVASNPRCLHFYANGTRCRLPTRYPELPFCPRHISLPDHQHAPVDLSPVLLAGLPDLATPAAVNTLMARITLLLSQNRISPRHAATFGYLANLLLGSIREMQRLQSAKNPLSPNASRLSDSSPSRAPIPPVPRPRCQPPKKSPTPPITGPPTNDQ